MASKEFTVSYLAHISAQVEEGIPDHEIREARVRLEGVIGPGRRLAEHQWLVHLLIDDTDRVVGKLLKSRFRDPWHTVARLSESGWGLVGDFDNRSEACVKLLSWLSEHQPEVFDA